MNEKRIDDAAIPSKNGDGRCLEEIVRGHQRYQKMIRNDKDLTH